MGQIWKVIRLLAFGTSAVFWFSALWGSVNWFAGFIFFLWIGLSLLRESGLDLSKERLKHLLITYCISFIFFLVLDAGLGLRMYQYWKYDYYDQPVHWLVLYLISYPFVGLVLSRSLQMLGWGRSGRRVSSVTLRDKMCLLALTIVFILCLSVFDLRSNNMIEYGSYIFLVSTWFIIFADYIRRRFQKPFRELWLTFVVSVGFGFIAEFANTFSGEWEYINLPIKTEIFNIPLFVLAFWFLLATTVFLEDMVKQIIACDKER